MGAALSNWEEEYSDFSERTEKFIFCLVVEEREFWVPKEKLAFISDFFAKLLFDTNFEEARKGRAELKEKKAEDVLEFLRCCIEEPIWKKVDGMLLDVKLNNIGCFYNF